MSIESTLEQVRLIANGFTEPDDDLAPVLIIETPWETKIMLVEYADDEQKHTCFDVMLPNFIHRTKARSVTFVSTGWMSMLTPDEGRTMMAAAVRDEDGELHARNPRAVRPSDDPRRKEVALVIYITATQSEAKMARVIRSPDLPPLIGDFEDSDYKAQSFILRAARRALREVAR